MSNKKSKKAGTMPPPPPKRKASSTKKSSHQSKSPSWLNAVKDPANHEPVAVPDQDAAPTIKYASRTVGTISTYDAAVTPSTSHGVLLGFGDYMSALGSADGDVMAFCLKKYSSSADRYNSAIEPALTNSGQVINRRAMFPAIDASDSTSLYPYQYRLTAMKVKIIPEMPELFRAGELTAVLAEPRNKVGTCTFGSGTLSDLNPINAVYGSTNSATNFSMDDADVRNRARRLAVDRMPDGTFDIRWIPTGVPEYQRLVTSSNYSTIPLDTHAASLIVAIKGDITESPSATGNTFRVVVDQHWEVKAGAVEQLVVRPTPSHYDPMALAACLNAFQTMPMAEDFSHGGSRVLDDGRQTSSGTSFEGVTRGFNKLWDLSQTSLGQKIAVEVARASVNHMAGRQRFLRDF